MCSSDLALYSEKRRVHGWNHALALGRLAAGGPRDFKALANGQLGPEFKEASEVHLISNAGVAELRTIPDGWTVHNLR